MSLSDKQIKKLKNCAKKIIHTAGNTVKGNVIDAVLVLDCTQTAEVLNAQAISVLSALRTIGSPFLNIRLNIIKWKGENIYDRFVSSYPNVMLGITVNEKDFIENTALTYDSLLILLQKNYKKSHMYLMLANSEITFTDAANLSAKIEPLTLKKIITISEDGSITGPMKLQLPKPEEASSNDADTVSDVNNTHAADDTNTAVDTNLTDDTNAAVDTNLTADTNTAVDTNLTDDTNTADNTESL